MGGSYPYLKLNSDGPRFAVNRASNATPDIHAFFRSMMYRIDRRKSKFIIAAACLVILALIYYANTKSVQSFDDGLVYTVVIDAGSTGSRIHVFKLYHDKSSGEKSKKFDIKLLKQELFVKVKPGLSSYAKNPDEATKSIQTLLDKALDVIPKEYQSRAQVTLKATAGLRMISDEIANQILENISSLFKKYPFQSQKPDAEIMDGKYEGIYSWITLNYALRSFSDQSEASTVSLDLGGGSTQVTFTPEKKVDANEREYLVDFKLDELDYSIFAKSFLGFGLMSARMNIFKLDKYQNATLPRTHLSSVCLPTAHSSTWLQQGTDFTVLGPESEQKNAFLSCYKTVQKSVKGQIQAPSELKDKKLYAFSFYFDRLKSAHMVDEQGGVVSLSDILDKAMSVCNKSSQNIGIDTNDKDFPFLCMDLTYIYTILSHGFGIPNSKEIYIYNKINSMEINWALGAAFHMLSV